MYIYNLPDDLLRDGALNSADVSIFNYQVPQSAVNNKINMSRHVISFLVEGQKDVRFADTTISVDTTQALLIAKGNFLMTEYIGNTSFKCLLFFFSPKKVSDFLVRYSYIEADDGKGAATSLNFYFRIEKDQFIYQFINSLNESFALKDPLSQHILSLKFEEILLYLTEKYGRPFIVYLKSLLDDERLLSFKSVIENNICSNVSIAEIAFLCNMSLSTFKRKFINIYQTSPGKWFQKQRLNKAREMMITRRMKASELYLDFGYNSLSSFSTAFKNEFGINPTEISLL